MLLETVPFDAAKYLTDTQDRAELAAEALATGDGDVIREVLDIVARARGWAVSRPMPA